MLSKKQKKKEIDDWAIEKPKFLEARMKLGVVAPEDNDEYRKLIADALEKYSLSESPAMATKEIGREGSGGKLHAKRKHEERVAPKGHVSMEHYGLVHAPVKMKQAMKIPEAKKAVDTEWEKLKNAPAWDLGKMKPKAKVIAEAEANGVDVHFGRYVT